MLVLSSKWIRRCIIMILGFGSFLLCSNSHHAYSVCVMLERNKTDEEFSHKKALFGLQLFQLLIVSKETCRNCNTKMAPVA